MMLACCVHICSLQKIQAYTPDDYTIQLFAKCDEFMEGLCQHLQVEIPPFVLHKRSQVVSEAIVGSDGKKGVKGHRHRARYG